MREVCGIKDDMQGMKDDIQGMKEQIGNLGHAVKNLELHIENVTDRNICIIAEGHLDLSRKLTEAVEVASLA